MLVIHGTYHWRPRRTAFRNDYCRTCAGPRLSVQVRTLDVVHVYWIPLIPLGFRRRWVCSTCGSYPHAATRTRRGFKIAGALILGLMTFGVWAVPIDPPDAVFLWGLRLGLALATCAAAFAAFKHSPEPRLKAMLTEVKPFEGWTCPLCRGQLMNIPDWHCTVCGVEHKPLQIQAG